MVLNIPGSIFTEPKVLRDEEIDTGLVKPVTNDYIVGIDNVPGAFEDTTNEVEVLTLNIPANTVSKGIIINAHINQQITTVGGTTILTWRIKTGTDGSETTKRSIKITNQLTQIDVVDYLWFDDYSGEFVPSTIPTFFSYIDESLNWKQKQTVSITAQFDDAQSIFQARGIYLEVLGY